MRALIVALLALAAAVPAEAQTSRSRPATGQEAARLVDGLTHEERLGELARVIGGAHYLRILCNGRGDQRWRGMMMRLMDLEAPAGPQRTALAGAFNDGYRAEEERFELCTPAAEASGAELAAKGKRLADGLAARHRPQ